MGLEEREVYTENYLEKRNYAGKIISDLLAKNPSLRHTEGVTYLCRIKSNGYLKIGTSTQLESRMRRLGAELLMSLPGGESLELVAHYELSKYRIPCRGELFFDRPEVYEWFESRVSMNRSGLADTSLRKASPSDLQRCIGCGKHKALIDFGTHSTSRTGYYRRCKACRSQIPSSVNVQSIISRGS